MLGLLNARPKPWIVTELACTHHRFAATNRQSLSLGSVVLRGGETCRQNHSTTCRIRNKSSGGGASSVWHAIFPCARECHSHNLVPSFYQDNKGEGSWNVAWDVRPARWLHSSDSAWFLFGVCSCLSLPLDVVVGDNPDVNVKKEDDVVVRASLEEIFDSTPNEENPQKYKVIGVPGDGRCLFRAVTYGACLKCAEELPDENCQRELADNLRARVVDELLKRRKETEWMIEGDFDAYVESIQRPNAWGGEPELLMASHVLKVPISVFMIDRRSKELVNIASYGHNEYGQDELPIQVLFHGYGHYDVLEIFPDNTTSQKKEL